MTELLVAAVIKFIEQGGLYTLLGLYLLTVIAGAFVTWKLFTRYEEAQEARIVETRELADRTITAITEIKATIDAATRTAEVNSKLSEANRATIEGFRDTVNNIIRNMMERRER